MFKYVINTPPEVNKPLSAKYKRSFAYPTFSERTPAILNGVIQTLENNKPRIQKEYGKDGLKDVEDIQEKVRNFIKCITEDQPLTEIPSNDEHTKIYNDIIKEKTKENNNEKISWFQTEWLFAECYLYKHLSHFFQKSKFMNDFDPFMDAKMGTLLGAEEAVVIFGQDIIAVKQTKLLTEEKKKIAFKQFLKYSLWGNKADLSLSGGKTIAACEFSTSVNQLDKYILVNDSDDAYEIINNSPNKVIDIILDNAGFELFNDLIFADYLIWSGLADTINFHGKAFPWFVSDVTSQDIKMLLTALSTFKYPKIVQLATSWHEYFKNGKWKTSFDNFWVTPYEFYKMKEESPKLYSKIGESKIAIFKGDLNYRKLVSDIYWDPITSFESCLRGFAPTNVLALRTIKSDTVCGLKKGLAEEIEKVDSDWLITGKYALVQLHPIKIN